MLEKSPLTLEQIDAQSAIELPERELPALVTIACVVGCFGSISVTVQNIHIAAAICATVQALTSLTGAQLSCTTSA